MPHLILACVFSTVAIATAQVESPHTTHVDARVEVAMDMDFEKPCIRVSINGQGPYRFLLDTGCTPAAVINDDLVEELGLELGEPGRVGDPINPQAIETRAVRIDELRIGEATFRDINAITWDRAALYHGEDAPRGIIGFALFRELLLTLDYPASRVVIEHGSLPEADGQHIIPFGRDRGIPTIDIELAGRDVTAHIDSGSPGGFTLPKTLADQLPTVGEPRVVGRARTVNSEFELTQVDLDGTAAIGSHRIERPPLLLNEMLPKANIGSRLLRGFAITFDQRESHVRFEGQARVLPERKRYGVMMRGGGAGPMIVAGTVPGSIAERAGLVEGDVIVSIDGVPSESLSASGRMAAFQRPSIALTVERAGKQLQIEMTLR